MRKVSSSNGSVLFFVSILLFASFFAARPTSATQPPVDVTTLSVQRIGEPRRVDPARAYDTSSGELIFNVYEPLIFFSDKPVLPASTKNVSASGFSDLSKFEPLLADSMPAFSEDRLNWTFTVRTGVKFHPWKAANSSLITDQYLTAEDVEYTFERMLVQDQQGGPSCLINLPATGYWFFDSLDADGVTNTIEPVATPGQGERLVASLIDNFVTRSGNTVTFHFVHPSSENELMQIFSQTWGCIVNKDFCIEHGCWNGTFYDGWSTDYRRKPSNSYSPLDKYYSKSKYPSNAPDVPAMCGTGPYNMAYWNATAFEQRLNKFDDYWRGWSGNHIQTIIVRKESSWQTAKMMFLNGAFDSITVQGRKDLLQSVDPYVTLPGIAYYYDAPEMANEALAFTMNVSYESPYRPKVKGISVPDFFSNVHARKAFASALNFTQYLEYCRDSPWPVIQPTSWWIKGLAPNYENKSLVPYGINTAAIEEELKATYYPSVGNQSVWDAGFEVYLIYNVGNERRRTTMEMIAATFSSINPNFRCTLVGINLWDWWWSDFYFPVFFIGRMGDYADVDNWVRPYMHSLGDFAYFQRYNDTYVDNLIDQGMALPDGPARNATYQELQYIYWRDVVSLPVAQSLASFWFRDWVKGWYYNPMYPGLYFYDLYKDPPQDIQDVDVNVTLVPITTYAVIQVYHGEMRRGMVGQPATTYLPAIMTYSITVKRNDNNSAAALLYTAVALKRSATGYEGQYPNVTYVILAPGGSVTLTLDWYENGVDQNMTGNSTGISWQVGCEICPVMSNANDTDLTNNYIADGTVQVKTLTGDINGDGIVDIFDAIRLAGSFGGGIRPCPDADIYPPLNPDGVVDIYDAILLASNFNKHVP